MAGMGSNSSIGYYAFILGVIIAIIAGLIVGYSPTMLGTATAYIPLIVGILGVIIGFLNLHDKDIVNFLIAAVALSVVAISAAGFASLDVVIAPVGSMIAAVVGYIAALVAPAAIILAIKVIWDMSTTP